MAMPALAEKDGYSQGWYIGLDNLYFLSYDARVLWSHTDLPLECDQWFPGHLELSDGRCRPSDKVFVDPPQNFHSNGLLPGLHAGRAWDHLRVELEYFFREHHGYEGVAPFYRSGPYLNLLGYDETDEWLHGRSKEFRFSAERIAEVWAHCGFFNIYYDFRELGGSLVPYVGAGAGYAYSCATTGSCPPVPATAAASCRPSQLPSRRRRTAIRALRPALIAWGGRPCWPGCLAPTSANAQPVAGA